MTKIRFQRRILDPHPHIDCRKRIINILSSLPTVEAKSEGRKESYSPFSRADPRKTKSFQLDALHGARLHAKNKRGLSQREKASSICKFNRTWPTSNNSASNSDNKLPPVPGYYFRVTEGNFPQFHRARILILAKPCRLAEHRGRVSTLHTGRSSFDLNSGVIHKERERGRGRGKRSKFRRQRGAAYKAAGAKASGREARRVGQEITSPDVRSFGFRALCTTQDSGGAGWLLHKEKRHGEGLRGGNEREGEERRGEGRRKRRPGRKEEVGGNWGES